jgi:hypothetical protein
MVAGSGKADENEQGEKEKVFVVSQHFLSFLTISFYAAKKYKI